MIGALYIHIPFCASRCAYCAFASEATRDDALMDAYVDSLVMQLRRASRAGLLGGVRTIYIGGGTPTHLGARRLASLCYALSLSVRLENVVEFTVEANPESLTSQMVRDLFALGIDRFSLGVQSFDDGVLASFGRPHTADDARRAIEAVHARTNRLSVDLICGAPAQSMSSWEESVAEAVRLGVTHVSAYPLSVEEGTPLARSVADGRLAAPDDDVQADMMLRASDILAVAGFERYETASYAKPGFESRHNTVYWSGVEYLGLGAAAASMLTPADWRACLEAGLFGQVGEDTGGDAVGDAGGRADRRGDANGGGEVPGGEVPGGEVPDGGITGEDVARLRVSADSDAGAFAASGGCPACDVEALDSRSSRIEDVMLALRMSRGADAGLVSEAAELAHELPATLEGLERDGLLVSSSAGWRPTERGWLLGNEVWGAIWSLA